MKDENYKDKFEARNKIYLFTLIERRGYEATIEHVYGKEREYLEMYSGNMDFDNFFAWIRQGDKFNKILSFDGTSGGNDKTSKKDNLNYFDKHIYLKSGNSSFKRILGNDTDAMVFESLYIKMLDL
jgi:hypothetical protein